MSDQSAQFARAAAAAGCQILSQGGSALIGAGAWSMAAGGAGMVPITLGAMSVFAANYAGCWDSDNPGSAPANPVGSQGQCIRVDGCGAAQGLGPEGWFDITEGCPYEFFEATVVASPPDEPWDRYEFTWINCTTKETHTYQQIEQKGTQFRLRPCDGASCVETAPGPPPTYQPFNYTDPDTGCDLTVEFKGWSMLPGEQLRPVLKIAPATPPAARATGGVITNCNFSPSIYLPSPDGGDGTPPVPPAPWDPSWDDWDPAGGGKPPWIDLVGGLLGGFLGSAIEDAINSAFPQVIPQYRYTMRAACDYKQDGTFEDYTITLPEAPFSERVLAMQEMQIDFLQQHLLWKTPTCGGGGQPVTGDPVTLNWISDEVSPASGTRINKRLVYFDQNNTPLQTTVDHWKNFVWQAGPVVVGITGTPLGKPQVWAASEAEGKRVLEHAAQIAGVDLSNGEWKLGSPKDPRYGVSGTMRILKRKGVLGITSRQGSNGYPEGLPG